MSGSLQTSVRAEPKRIVVAGGGLAAQRFAETLRRGGEERPITIVCGEQHPPYDRPPLSKGLLRGETAAGEIELRPASWYADNEVELRLGSAAVGLDPDRRWLLLEGGARLRYAELLIATGSAPRRVPGLEPRSNVHELRSRADAERLRAELGSIGRLAIVGAGFIGQEVASCARGLGIDVVLIESLPAPLATVLGERVGGLFEQMHRAHGVDVELGVPVAGLRGRERVEAIELRDGRTIPADAVVIGVGVVPATGWLRGTPLHEPGGIRTDAGGRTAVPGVFAAGDVARPLDPLTGLRSRSEHWEAAVLQGRAAARSLLGQEPSPPSPSSFWSDLYGRRIQYLGDATRADDVLLEGGPGRDGFRAEYLRRGRTVACLLADRPRELAHARRRVTAGLRDLAAASDLETAVMIEGGSKDEVPASGR